MENLIKKYEKEKSPYYTSYPTLGNWSESFSNFDFISSLKKFCLQKDNSFGLYVHFPYCQNKCYFCMCNSKVVHDEDKIREFLQITSKELELFKKFFEEQGVRPRIKYIHLGGGSPTIIGKKDLTDYIEKIKSIADTSELNEFSIEVDVRTIDIDKLNFYKQLGIDRLSFGIQDLDPDVQKAVNRIQPLELIQPLVNFAKKNFKSINFDLLHGLPKQTRESFKKTLKIVKELSPDRITLLRYCHIPEKAKIQRMINPLDLPSEEEKTKMFLEAKEFLKDAGYVHVGIDHFAKNTDELALCKKENFLCRDFNGFSPATTKNIIGIGPASTSSFGDCYSQNVYLSDYFSLLNKGEFPILKGYKLNKNDFIRRDLINGILCSNFLNFQQIGEKYEINPQDYFSKEFALLDSFVNDGIIEFSKDDLILNITKKGRIFARHVCKLFDDYLREQEYEVHGL